MVRNEQLLALRQAAVVRGVGHPTPIFASRALNSEVWDTEGNRYVDFAGGIQLGEGVSTRTGPGAGRSSRTPASLRLSEPQRRLRCASIGSLHYR